MIHSINNFTLKNLFLNPLNADACCDNFIGTLVYGNNGFEFNNQNIYFGLELKSKTNNAIVQYREEMDYLNFKPHSQNRKIVILLESPHNEEYNAQLQIAKSGPACGNSGCVFNNNAIRVFNANINIIVNKLNPNPKEEFDIYFVNAIQYQCSLGKTNFNRNLRDHIFINLWSNPIYDFKNDLLERLQIISPDLIINACTQNLKNSCCNASQIASNFNYLDANYHISLWYNNVILI